MGHCLFCSICLCLISAITSLMLHHQRCYVNVLRHGITNGCLQALLFHAYSVCFNIMWQEFNLPAVCVTRALLRLERTMNSLCH